MNSTKIAIVFGLAMMATIASFAVYNHQKHTSPHHGLSIHDLALSEHIPELHLRLAEFNQWTVRHEKQYSKPEAILRFKTWMRNYEIVEEHNSQNLSYTLEMNKFADLSSEEFGALYTGFNAEQAAREIQSSEVAVLEENLQATSVDWRAKGAVGYIRNQAQCGACWAFASCTGLEALYFIKKGTLPNFAEQQLVDCSSSYGNQGCSGGTMTATYQYTQKYGVQDESAYPYTGKAGSCRYKSSNVFKNLGHKTLQQSDTQIKAAVDQIPVTVGVAASASVFQLYKTGVLSSSQCGTQLNHAITIVGYNTSGAQKYWIVRNEWGTKWGEQGNAKILMSSGQGICGINMMASYPTA